MDPSLGQLVSDKETPEQVKMSMSADRRAGYRRTAPRILAVVRLCLHGVDGVVEVVGVGIDRVPKVNVDSQTAP